MAKFSLSFESPGKGCTHLYIISHGCRHCRELNRLFKNCPTSSPFESLKINQPPCTSLTPAIVRIDNPPAEESLPTVNSEKKNNAPLFTPQSKTITNSPVGYYSLSLNCEFSQTKKVLNYLPLFEDPGITEDNFDLSIFDDSELNFHKQASSDICRYFKQRD